MPFITYRVSVFLFLIWLKVLHRFKIYAGRIYRERRLYMRA
jgi:hypothetical protein